MMVPLGKGALCCAGIAAVTAVMPPAATAGTPNPPAGMVSARTSSCTSIPTVRYGSSGYYVWAFQRIYNNYNKHGAFGWPKVATDGSFGAGTRSAAVRLQGWLGLSKDGTIGPRSWAAMTDRTCDLKKYINW